MRIFLDASILFTAAHNPNGKAALVIELGRSGIWRLATSPYAAEEARCNIARKFSACRDRLSSSNASAERPNLSGKGTVVANARNPRAATRPPSAPLARCSCRCPAPPQVPPHLR